MKIRDAVQQRNPSLRAVTLMSVFIMMASAGRAAASTDYFEFAPEQLLGARVLSVSKKAETVADAPAAVYVVTSEDIMRSGVTNIPDALRMVPGVNVAQSDSNSWAISIRGFNSGLANKLLVLIDGRTIYNPVFGGVLWEAHDLMLEDIDRIEVVRGPGGALWGANAVNGVINIITKKAGDTQGNLASGLYGMEERGTLNVRHGGSFGEGDFYRLYAKGFNRDSSRKQNGDDTYDEWRGYRTGFRADWGDDFTLQGDAYHNDTKQLRPHFSLIAPFAPVETQTLTYEGVNLLGRWTDKRDDGSQFAVQSYMDWARRKEPINFTDNRAIFDVESQYNFAPLGRNEIIAGAGFRFMADNEEGDNNTSFSPKGRRDSLYSAFVQDKITLEPDRWYVTLGSKFEHNEYSGYEVQPSARIQFHPDSSQTAWAAVSRAVRTPTPIEEDLTSTLATAASVRAAFVPNPDFKSERLTAYEAGYRNQVTPSLSVDIAAFYNNYDQLATTSFLSPSIVSNGVDPLHFLLPVQFRNDMTGKSHGIELAASWTINPDLKIAGNYSYLRLSVDSPDVTEEGAEDIYPVQQAGMRLSWNIEEDWTLDAGASYVGRLKGSRVDDYVRLDLNLGWRISNAVQFNAIGQNLGEASHREFGSATDINAGEIQRSIFGKLTWKF